MDDFAWLGLHGRVHDFDSLMAALFQPMAQGTVRTISERLYFLTFWQLFGMEALPYRILVFLTQFANLVLLTVVTRNLTGSALAGFLAPILWLASPVLYVPMAWTSAYNQILCSFFFLLQLYLLIRFVETNNKRYYAGLWAAFLLGFGVLELNVVFPAIAAAYLLLHARRYLAYTAPMFLVSIAYTILHRTVGRGLETSVYAMNWHPLSLLSVLHEYIWLSVSAHSMAIRMKELFYHAGTIVVIALIAFVLFQLHRRRWLVLFFLAWFAITIAPYLPLYNHVSDYYLTVPMIGLAMLGAWGLDQAWRSGTLARVTAVAVALIFAVPCARLEWYMTQAYRDNSRKVRTIVRGIAYAHKLHPNKLIVLKGVDSDLFWTGLYDRPHIALGWTELYLTPESERNIEPFPERGSLADRFLPASVALNAISRNAAVVYDVSGPRLRNVTPVYAQMLRSQQSSSFPAVINAGMPVYNEYLKDGWFEAYEDHRWTMKRAVVEMKGPATESGKLTLNGIVTPLHTKDGPLPVHVFVDDRRLGTQRIAPGTRNFQLSYDLPADLAGKTSIRVAVEVDRTVVAPPDVREIGLLFGTFEVTQ
jgi:hypothetical protein